MKNIMRLLAVAVLVAMNFAASAQKKSDPQGVVDDAKNAVSSKIAQDPNTMVIGEDAWRVLKRNSQLNHYLQDSSNYIFYG